MAHEAAFAKSAKRQNAPRNDEQESVACLEGFEPASRPVVAFFKQHLGDHEA